MSTPSTEDRLSALEGRLARIEALADKAAAAFTRLKDSPQAKSVLKMLGIDLS